MARPREFEVDAVLASAMDVFWLKGYHATSIDDLVAATGLQRGSLYGAFTDKRTLYRAALKRYVHRVLEDVRHRRAAAEDPVEAVRGFVRSIALSFTTEPMIERGCLVGNTCTELAGDDSEAARDVAAFFDGLRAELSGALRDGQRHGTFPSNRDPDAVALLLVTSLQGIAVLAKSRPGAVVVETVLAELLRNLV